MKKAVIFDLDGTLSDSISSMKYCGDRALAEYGFRNITVDEYKIFVGDGAATLIKRCLKAAGDENLEYFDRAFAKYMEEFKEHAMYGVKPYDGVVELLKALKEKGLKLAVLSNKPHQGTIEVVENLFGKDVFDCLMGQQDGVPIKPAPDGVFSIARELGMEVEDFLYVGDTCTDMQTGKSAGAFTIGVLWGFRDRQELEENHADAIVEKPIQILDYIY